MMSCRANNSSLSPDHLTTVLTMHSSAQLDGANKKTVYK